jgi:hypothetical protein
MTAPVSIAISLVSHTNAGKTTLARTLLQRDVGEVRDAPHVTECASDHLLLRADDGTELRLWDTPGFGDSVRLARRLRAQGNPLGWFLSEVWDRWHDRPFWASQQALRHVRERTDVVLYLVSAAESPDAAGYVEPEMELLAWVGKPVIVLLNQLGAPRAAAEEAADVERWQRHLLTHARAVSVLPMDAFARCWVQEGTLLRAIEAVLEPPLREAMVCLRTHWAQQRRATFQQSMQSLAASLGRVAAARESVADAPGLRERLRRFGATFAPLVGAKAGEAGEGDAAALAQQALAAGLDAEVRTSTSELIALHGLEGRAQGEILARLATHFEVQRRVDEGKAGVLGGVVTGALAGLKADIVTGGLTLGGGMLAGGLLGALGAAGLARGINVMRGGGPASVGWAADAMEPMVEAALLRYLAVAHFGRGRGEWAQGESPAYWRTVVAAALAPRSEALAALWRTRSTRFENAGEAARLADALRPLIAAAARDTLERLYPGTWPEVAPAMAEAESHP